LHTVGILFTNVSAVCMDTISVTPAVQHDFGPMNNFEHFDFFAMVLAAVILIPQKQD